MQPLIRVEQNPASELEYRLLGYEWLEVLWVEPWALAVPGEEYGTWCDRRVAVQYVCMTEVGLLRIGADDFWAALEDYEEYAASKRVDTDTAPLQIVASAGSIVHVGSSAGSSFGAIGHAREAKIEQSITWDFDVL